MPAFFLAARGLIAAEVVPLAAPLVGLGELERDFVELREARRLVSTLAAKPGLVTMGAVEGRLVAGRLWTELRRDPMLQAPATRHDRSIAT